MRKFLLSVLSLAVALSASAQSAFVGKKPAIGGPEVRVAEPVRLPAVTVTKPGSAAAAVPGDSDIRFPSGVTPSPRAVWPTSQAFAANAAPASVPSASGGTGATFRAGDVFELQMSGMPAEDSMTFQKMFTIGGDGFVNIPYGGQIRASGLTQSQLEKAIERRLIDEKIFRWPTATINVPTTTRYVTIGGAVRQPSRMLWSADLTITSAINACGGPGDFASDKLNLIRGGSVIPYRLKQLKKNPADDPHLQPGDQVELQ